MKHRGIVVLGLIGVLVAIPFATTAWEERRLYDRSRVADEVGYALPSVARITDTSARIWSLADGKNYSWSFSASESLLPWVESVAKLEYGRSWKAVKRLPDGREETSYITLAADNCSAMLETFRP